MKFHALEEICELLLSENGKRLIVVGVNGRLE
jgi:hypothetical protein